MKRKEEKVEKMRKPENKKDALDDCAELERLWNKDLKDEKMKEAVWNELGPEG